MKNNNTVSVSFMLLGILFCVCLVAANLLETKVVRIWKITATAGLVVFPISYIINDCIAEVWGFRKARLIIWMGFAMNFMVVALGQLAKKIEGEPSHRIASMDITALRNAYGRQLGSFYIEAPMKGIEGNIPMTFIRAPYIKEVWGDAEVLAEVDGKIVAARQGNQLVTAFHPELNESLEIHKYFLGMCSK